MSASWNCSPASPRPRHRGPSGVPACGGLDHLRRVVHAQHVGARPARGQGGGQVAGAAAQVGYERGVVRADPAEQVEERPRPLVAEPQVSSWIPHDCPPISLDIEISDWALSTGITLLMSRDMLPAWWSRQARVRDCRDEVDDLVAAWHAERPDLDVEPLQVLSRVSRLARHLDRARRVAFTGHGLETWEFDVLSALRRQGAPYQLSPGALLRTTLVTSGTMTNRVDRLAEGRPGPPGARPAGPPRGPGHADPGRGGPGRRGPGGSPAQRARAAQRAQRGRPPDPGRLAPGSARPAGRLAPPDIDPPGYWPHRTANPPGRLTLPSVLPTRAR